MVAKPEVLAIIPARGGSKGIPRKNIRSFAGYPLIAYSIAAGLQSELVTRTIISTDDDEIAEVARQWGAETPFMRPAEFARDNTTDFPVFEHALTWLADHENYHPDVVVQLRPTTPVRPLHCVDDAVRMLLDHPGADSVRGVVEAGQNPFKMWRLDPATHQMRPLVGVDGIKEAYNAPRQQLPAVHWQTGHIDAIRPRTILEKKSMSGDLILGLVIDPSFTVDIDTPADWIQYEQLVNSGTLQMVDPANARRSFPSKLSLVVMDFDGVLTDNRVWVNERGEEMVAASRGDSMGIRIVRERTGVEFMVISTEVNPVVKARCKKMNVEVFQGVESKADLFREVLQKKGIDPVETIFIGNDVNDLGCFSACGYAVAPSNAEVEAKRRADLILSARGGKGAVRELCDMILQRYENQK